MTPLAIATADDAHPDLEPEFFRAAAICAPYTMTSLERRYALWQAVGHLHRIGVPGAILECGVWRGGSALLAALALRQHRDFDRDIWLFDTFEGMSEPSEHDVEARTGVRADEHIDILQRDKSSHTFAYASLGEVQLNMELACYPEERVPHYVEGRVEDTLPAQAPDLIALLRLDTDWYESTRHKLEQLWHRVHPVVLIIDDYGHWTGAPRPSMSSSRTVTTHRCCVASTTPAGSASSGERAASSAAAVG